MKGLSTQKIFFSLAIMALCGCSLERAPTKQRTHTPDLAKLQADRTPRIPDFVDPLASNSLASGPFASKSALAPCELLNQLAQTDGTGVYSYFHQLEWDEKSRSHMGAINLGESLLVQSYIASTFKTPTNEEFLKMVKEKYEDGEIGAIANWFPGFVERTGGAISLDILRHYKVRGQMEMSFPGIWGRPTDIAQSLFFSLVQKAHSLKDVDPNRTPILSAKVSPDDSTSPLTRKLALLPQDIQSLPKEIFLVLKSTFTDLADRDQNAYAARCSLVLLQRAFAQMIAIKGYKTPVLTNSKWNLPAAREMQKNLENFSVQNVNGYFYDVAEDKNVVLEPQDIQDYDPTKKLLIASNTRENTNPTSFEWLPVQLSLLEASTSMFVATNPATIDENKAPNLLGDLKDKKNSALLPKEANTLPLGLISMVYKNLKFLNIQKVDRQGLPTEDESAVRGFVLVDSSSGENLVKLDNVLSLLESSIRLEQALSAQAKMKMEELAELNSEYTPTRIATLRSFRDALRKLIYPLVVSATKMVGDKTTKIAESTTGGHCVALAAWDKSTGKLTPKATCSDDQLKRYNSVLLMVASATKSPALSKKVPAAFW